MNRSIRTRLKNIINRNNGYIARIRRIHMSDFLKGNFTTAKDVVDTSPTEESLEQRFEKEALKKLGGSIAFVAKKEVLWGDEDESIKK